MEVRRASAKIKTRYAQICMDRFEQNGNNETIVHEFMQRESEKKWGKEKKARSVQYEKNSNPLEMRRQGIWRQFACSILIGRIAE